MKCELTGSILNWYFQYIFTCKAFDLSLHYNVSKKKIESHWGFLYREKYLLKTNTDMKLKLACSMYPFAMNSLVLNSRFFQGLKKTDPVSAMTSVCLSNWKYIYFRKNVIFIIDVCNRFYILPQQNSIRTQNL